MYLIYLTGRGVLPGSPTGWSTRPRHAQGWGHHHSLPGCAVAEAQLEGQVSHHEVWVPQSPGAPCPASLSPEGTMDRLCVSEILSLASLGTGFPLQGEAAAVCTEIHLIFAALWLPGPRRRLVPRWQ